MKTLFASIGCLILILLLGSSFSSVQKSASSYKIANTFHIEGDGGWDYLTVDDVTGRLFISHGDMVQVIDEKSGKLLGTIANTKGVHGIALAPDLNKGFVSSGRDSSVTIFNLKTLGVIKKIKVPARNPDAILYDPVTKRVYTFNGGSSNTTIIDTKINKVIDIIALDGRPEFAVTDGKGKIFVNIQDRSVIQVINTSTRKLMGPWLLEPGRGPTGLAIDIENQRLFSGCRNELMVILDTQNGNIITTLPIGDYVDGIAFDPMKKCAYSSNGDGTLTVVWAQDNYSYKVMENVVTKKEARTIALDKKTHHIFLPVAEFEASSGQAGGSHSRPNIKPNTFVILDIVPLN
jgi:YVTN family beta-propeller protein